LNLNCLMAIWKAHFSENWSVMNVSTRTYHILAANDTFGLHSCTRKGH
jgi:hypothetical protein